MKTCLICHQDYRPLRSTSRYCSGACRKRAQRAGIAQSRVLPKPEREVVYYVRFGDRVKIGTSRRLALRLQAVPHDEVLATEPGSYNLERRRHVQFQGDRLVGEWFTYSDELRSHVARLRGAAEEAPWR